MCLWRTKTSNLKGKGLLQCKPQTSEILVSLRKWGKRNRFLALKAKIVAEGIQAI